MTHLLSHFILREEHHLFSECCAPELWGVRELLALQGGGTGTKQPVFPKRTCSYKVPASMASIRLITAARYVSAPFSRPKHAIDGAKRAKTYFRRIITHTPRTVRLSS